ncbi:hypothetical protein HK096_009589, partial [Nowakowskiella sp. JEL0078]
ITESMVLGNERGMIILQVLNFGIWGFAMIMLIIVGIFIFRPIVELAKTDRKLCVEAFLQLPKDTVLECYRKYKVDTNLDGQVVQVGDDDRSEISSNQSDDEKDEDEEKTVIYVNKKSVFARITIQYIIVLAWVVFFFINK